jgi:cyanophycinase
MGEMSDDQVGTLLLAGGAEFGGGMQIPDRHIINLAGGESARISIIPAAAAPDNNHQRAGNNGAVWFRQLGATDVKVLPLIDRTSADNYEIIADLQRSSLIYLLGGFPHYLEKSLSGSLSWKALRDVYHRGGVVAGSSAGAMVLCEYYYNPSSRAVLKGLGLLPGTCFLPHHNDFGKTWVPEVIRLNPQIVLIGVDEETAIISEESINDWTVYGKGSATIYQSSITDVYQNGERFRLFQQKV